MIGEWINHLWQSTLFACVAGFLTLAFRKNLAQVRYWLWLSASMKFLIPFALLIGFGSRLEWAPARRAATAVARPAVSFTVVEISQPFPRALRRAPSGRGDWTPIGLAGLWACGCAAVTAMRLRGWRRIREAVRASAPVGIPAALEVRSCPGLLEPGVVGVLRPRLLLPCGIVERLTPAQLDSVVAHELCHVRRRDNLTAAIHMAVEAMFWFHPMVWWIGARLVEERERACDEAVMRRGGDPRDYAEAIVSVCQWYVESPLACVAGVTGADIRKRLEAIMTGRIGQGLNGAKRLLLAGAAVAAVAGPMTVGLLIGVGNAPAMRAQAGAAAARVAALAAPALPAAQTEGPVGSAPLESSTPAVAPLAARPAEAEVPADMAPGGGLAAAQAQGAGQAGRSEGSSLAPPVGQDLAPHPAKPEGISQEEYARRLEYAIAHFGRKSGNRTLLGPLGRMYMKYGPPDRIDDRSSDAQNPSQIWRYNFLADLRSSAEFEFPMRDGAPQSSHINWPEPSATFVGVGEPPVVVLAPEVLRGGPAKGQRAETEGLPGRHASMDIYPPKEYRVLNVPLDGLSGPLLIFGRVLTKQDGVTKIVANFTEQFDQAQGLVARMNFTLDPGDYVCDVLVREQSRARLFGEMIKFQIK
jgi:beta-lactamase regulating signal transducer with metallopeptidase domain